MKRELVLGLMITLLTAGQAMSQEGVKIRAAAQEAYTASCDGSADAARRPMCLDEDGLLLKLAEAGGDEELMRRRMSQEGRLQLKQSRYGTIRRIVAPALSSERLARGQDPVEFVISYLARNADSFGIRAPGESLALPHVNRMAYGGMTVKFKQYYGSVEVYESQVMALIGKNGDLLMVHASVIPDDEIEKTMGEISALEETLLSPPCEDAVSFSDTEFGPKTVLFESAEHGGSQGAHLGYRVIGHDEDGKYVERLFEATTCASIVDRPLVHNYTDFASLKLYHPYTWGEFECVWSSFAGNECLEPWPDDLSVDQWGFFHDIRDKVLLDHSWENWLNCHYGSSPVSGMVGVTPGANLGSSSFYESAGNGCGNVVYSGFDSCVFDIVAHEQMHNVQDVEFSFGSGTCFSHSLKENTADAMAEMLNEPGDVDWIMGTGSSETRSFIHPNCSTYKWFSVAEYYNYGGCPHKNHGPIERAAYLLAEGGPDTIQGISFESIGLSDTAELYWDVLVASVLDQNFEETAQLARTLAADIWGSSSNQHTQVSNVMDAMDIWRTPSTVSYSVGRMLYFPISRFAPAAVNWSRWVWPALYIEHWLFYSAGTSETTPTDICWVKGLWENWHSSACAGLSSKYKTLLPVDAVVFDDKIWVFFHPAFSFSVQYFTIDKSLNVSSPVNTGRVSAGYPRVTTDGSGIIMSFLNVKNTPYLSYYTNGTWTNFSVPITVIPGITPTPVYDEDTDSLWLLSVGADEKTYVKKADWQCVLSSGSNCWANSGSVPKGSSSNFDVIAAGSPAGAMWGNELYVSQVITGPPSGTAVVYVDSCFNHAYSDCNSGTDCFRSGFLFCDESDPNNLFCYCTIPPTADWTHSVPRDISANSPGEMQTYLNKLWLFSSEGTYLQQAWKTAVGFEY